MIWLCSLAKLNGRAACIPTHRRWLTYNTCKKRSRYSNRTVSRTNSKNSCFLRIVRNCFTKVSKILSQSLLLKHYNFPWGRPPDPHEYCFHLIMPRPLYILLKFHSQSFPWLLSLLHYYFTYMFTTQVQSIQIFSLYNISLVLFRP